MKVVRGEPRAMPSREKMKPSFQRWAARRMEGDGKYAGEAVVAGGEGRGSFFLYKCNGIHTILHRKIAA